MDQGLVLYLISFLFLKGCEQEKTNVWLTECTCLQGVPRTQAVEK